MRPSDITNEEILAALRDNNPEMPWAMTAGDVAHRVWLNRGNTTPKVADRHVKPVLAALVESGEVVSTTGYRVDRIGRATHLRRNTTYYVFAEYAHTYAAGATQRAEISLKGRELAVALRNAHSERFTGAKGTSDGGVAMTLSFDQAAALLEQWNSAARSPDHDDAVTPQTALDDVAGTTFAE